MNTSEPISKNLPLNLVDPSPTNPRKFFDIHRLEELSKSIAVQGVTQAILCRPKGNRWEIVFGERRYRASKLAGKTTIPATVRELSDQEAREIQLTENFQREEVHPMDEAVAIYAAIKTGQYTMQEFADRVGKPLRYIAERNKLNDLVKEIQQAFFDSKVSVKDAVLLATVSKEDQLDFFKENQKNSNDGTMHHYRVLQAVNTYQGRLDTAVFDLADATLNPEMGACTKCLLNSNNANMLFTDNKPYPVCMNSQCFKKKTKVHYEISLKQVKEDPTIIPITTNWNSDNLIKDMEKKHGITLLNPRQYEKVEKPTYYEPDRNAYGDEKQHRQAIDEAKTSHEKQVVEYENKVASGRYKKAFVAEGSGRGAFVYVHLKKEAVQLLEKKPENTELNDIDEEIERIANEETKKKLLDGQSLWREIAEVLEPENLDISSEHWQQELDQDEINAIAYALHVECDYPFSDWASSVAGLEDNYVSMKELWRFQNITMKQLLHLLRIFMLAKIRDDNSPLENCGAALLMPVLRGPHYLNEKLFYMEKATADTADKRIKNINKRMAELEKRKDELLNPKPALKAGIAELATSAAPAAGGKPSLKSQVIEFVTYKKIPGKSINQFATEVSQLNVKGDWINGPATLDSAYKWCLAKAVVFNKESNIHTLKVFQEDDRVYISQLSHVTNGTTEFIGFELIKKEVAKP